MSSSLFMRFQGRFLLLMSITAALITYFLLPEHLGTLQRILIGWNVLAWLYLGCLWLKMLTTKVADIPRIAQIQDQSATLVLMLVILACTASIVTILSELSVLKHLTGTSRAWHLALTASTLIVSWSLLPSVFAVHYAHRHYLDQTDDVTPMIFPDKPDDPGYWDFLYYAFTIAVASQTADVETGNTGMRQITLLQSVISFVFNLIILGLSVNVGAGLLN